MNPSHRYVLRAALAGLLTAAAQAQTPKLIPMPREIHPIADKPILSGVRVVCAGCSSEDQFTADDLTRTLADRNVAAGSGTSAITIQLVHSAGTSLPAGFDEAMRAEGYRIEPSSAGLTVTAATTEGLFYGMQTVKQLIESTNGHATLHAASVRDWPAMRYRGLDDDLSRGPVPTLDFQKKMIRTLAEYKINLYSPYFEQTMQYASNPLPGFPNGSMSAADARTLVAFARQYHVTIIPEQEAFGHLHHTLVWEQYKDLAETPHGAVLAPAQPGSLELIKQWFTELAAIYPGPFLHVGSDETQDLGLGQTKADVDARGLGGPYLDFLQRIVTALEPLHRKLLFWGDIALNSPDLVKAMPQSFKDSTVAVSWEYNPHPEGFEKYIAPFTRTGYETWVAPGVNNWSRVYPNYTMGLANIQLFIRDGQRLGADGVLNTIWNDDGEGLFNQDWYGILYGAAASWQQGESPIPQFEQAYAQVFHGDATGKLNQAQLEIMAAHTLLREQAKTGDGSDGLFWIDPWSRDGLTNADKIRPYTHELRLHAERALTLIAEARAAAPAPAAAFTTSPGVAPVYNPANAYPSAPTSLRETDAIDALELGARRMDFIGLKFQLAEEMRLDYATALAAQDSARTSTDKKIRGSVAHELGDINNSANGRMQDLRDGYSMLRDLYEQAWLRSNRPYALRPVLEHYDYTVAIWLARADKVRAAQRQWSDSKTLPSAVDLGIPPAPAGVQ